MGAHLTARSVDLAISYQDLGQITVGGIATLLEGVLAVLIYRGHNWARVLVMLYAVVSISAAFTTWWVGGQDIRIETTLVTLSLDILVLLALSSRQAAAYSRRRQRR